MSCSSEQRSCVSRADRLRERELYRYYRPEQHKVEPPDTHRAPQALSPVTTLTALAQLVALRLGVQSVLINVITKDTQYTISEGTKTLNLADTTQAETDDDALWIGCASIKKQDSLCENTIALTGVFDGINPFFTVSDLSKDERFKDYSYVRESPHWRFYSGCPLTTNSGINIGALCILDDKPRDGLTKDQEQFANMMSRTIMMQLEMYREVDERRKGTRMSRGLNAFVEGKTHLESEDNIDGEPSPVATELDEQNAQPDLDRSNNNSDDVLSGVMSRVHSSVDHSGNSTPSQVDTQPGHVHNNIDLQQRVTFSRAANLLRESLELKDGGVVFLDTVVGISAGDSEDFGRSTSSAENSAKDEQRYTSSTDNETRRYYQSAFESSSGPQDDLKKAGVLGNSVDYPLDRANINNVPAFSPLSERALQRLLKKYPRGKLWSFDEDDSLSCEDERRVPSSGQTSVEVSQKRQHRKVEARMLQTCFPLVRQLLFVPLWDAGSVRFFSGCFAWTTSSLQIFSAETELSFLVAFGNSVMAEVSRLATIAADQQKGDFIGSISHELRSPLHGILASAEFLGETKCDSFQMSLINTIDSCGRTLLDTINHVLDFSKINSFERNFKKRTRARNNSVRATQGPQMPQIMNIYATTDVAAVCEEVVEGVYAGQVYQDISSTEISDIAPSTRCITSEGGLATHKSLLEGSGAHTTKKALEIVLNIEPGDYTFTTQPGAIRRVIMNLVTNSMKYTEQGFISVKLALRNLQSNHSKDPNGQIVELTVRDTGKGISSQYLRTRLFTPFAQEDTLSPGTGLGLSMVRSISNMLGGSIDIKSEVGQGTEVRIELPLLRAPGIYTPVSTSTPNTMGSIEHTQDDSIAVLRSEASGISVAIYGFESSGHSPIEAVAVEMKNAIQQYISEWYGLKLFSSWPSLDRPDIVIVDESNLLELLQSQPRGPSIIALCTNATRYGKSGMQQNGSEVEYLSKPFGPYKLAKALRSCLGRLRSRGSDLISQPEISRHNSTMAASSPAPTMEFEAMTIETGRRDLPINAQTTGTITAGDSENALMALEGSPMAGGSSCTAKQDFPFPQQLNPTDDNVHERDIRPELRQRNTEPLLTRAAWSLFPISAIDQTKEKTSSTPVSTIEAKRPPKILLVEDNKINLRLLKTFMMKREYHLVNDADNGQLAVQAVEAQKDGYDIIFMDISMPVMNGFEATRAIRQIEQSRRTSGPDDSAPALIIALTGLASSRDQSEAFTSGVDLFMTKPVSFKEVGRLLSNWEASGGSAGGVSRTDSVLGNG